VTVVRCEVTTPTPEWEQWVLLSADRHHDNPHCRWDLEKKHLDEALEREAAIFDFGDLFCAMQGKYDKRSDKGSIRPEHQHGNYLDRLVETAAEFYGPYAKNMVVLGQGNHETAIQKNHETNLTDRLAAILRTKYESPVMAGGYTGWVRFQFTRNKEAVSKRLWYTHGYGGGGPVTRDMIQAGNRQPVYINADFFCSGHTHDLWTADIVRMELNNANTLVRNDIKIIKTGTYKDAYRDGFGGFEIEKGHPPKPLGAQWLRFFWASNQLQYEIREAK
jgi:hypothetical protein